MKRKVAELTGPALDWAVARCEGAVGFEMRTFTGLSAELGPFPAIVWEEHWTELAEYPASTDWAIGGAIIEQERIQIFAYNTGDLWCAVKHVHKPEHILAINRDGPTPLVAAMRCYVASKMGEEIELPEELA